MKTQHLSDEAVAAYADGVLSGVGRERATRHVHECVECRTAVREQRETAAVLRATPAPPLPLALVDRLRSLPMTTPISTLPTALGPDGSTMLATFATPAAFVPDSGSSPSRESTAAGQRRRTKPIVLTAALFALAGSLTAGSVAHATVGGPDGSTDGHVVPAGHHAPAAGPQLIDQIQMLRAHRR